MTRELVLGVDFGSSSTVAGVLIGDTIQLVQEQGAESVFIGLMAFWCFVNVEHRRAVHLALLLFALLFAAIHWAEYLHGRRTLVRPLLNTIPFLMLLSITPFGRRREAAP